MAEREYDEELRLLTTCPSCGSGRVYQTDLLAGFGLPTVVEIECAACTKSGEAWQNPRGTGWLIRWDGSDDILNAEYAASDSEKQ